ncbi:MAG: hypothetical protein A2X64_01720 [Ignavibacteria bacterium GWF2_33_9]|nr:MAG: hypothetical protein A2X64_01720 [Ignavibacteria bacterium GWF2_33_9]
MWKYVIIIILIATSISYSKTNLSPFAKELNKQVLELQSLNLAQQEIIQNLQKNFPLKSNIIDTKSAKIQSQITAYASSIIKINSGFDKNKLENLGVKLVRISPSIYTAQVPVLKFPEFCQIAGVDYIETSGLVEMHLDSAENMAKITQVKLGTNNLPQPYTGKGVIVGIIDWGFDYTHPAFYDELGNCRISRVWDQTLDGLPPTPFNYGTEITSVDSLQTIQTDYDQSSHGSHVAGIAAGSGWPTAGLYEGVAPEAEIVMVALRHPRPEFTGYTNAFSDFVDAAKYIFDYAESVGKPAVANLSWGNVMGPKDGNSIITEALEDIVGKGKIFVNSAGNSGNSLVHSQLICSAQDSLNWTYFTYASTINFTPKEIFIDCWGENSKEFKLNLTSIESTSNPVTVCETDFFSSNQDTILTFEMLYKDEDTIRVTAFINQNEYNSRPRILLNIKSPNTHWFKVEVNSQNSNIHLFSSLIKNGNGYTSFFSRLNDTAATPGDAEYTIGDWASGDKLLCIGASVSKETFVNYKNFLYKVGSGLYGDRASFSSVGPSLDGRNKPDIVAPGSIIVSAANYSQTGYGAIPGKQDIVTRMEYYGKTYSYAAFQGTSMSSPVVAGAVALLLEMNPNFTPEELINLLKTTAITDNFTSDTIPNKYWGYGKLNLLGAFGKFLDINSYDLTESLSNVIIYPNPVFSTLSLSQIPEGSVSFEIFDIFGKCVLSVETIHELSLQKIDVSFLPPGVYFVRIGDIVQKFVKM